jgi:hypothetical protein
MIHALLNHHAKRIINRDSCNALMDCHVKGLLSIMLQDEPGNRIRMFYATDDHQLHQRAGAHNPDMTLAVHPHHCDITLVKVFGEVWNDTFRMEENETGSYHECRYSSKINCGRGGLEDTGRRFIATDYMRRQINQYGTYMDAKQLHSIYVPQGTEAAWLVIEGREDETYESVCYTTNPHFDPDGMYRPIVNPYSVAVILKQTAEKYLRTQGINPEHFA